MRFLIVGLALLTLAACGKPDGSGGASGPVSAFSNGRMAKPESPVEFADAAAVSTDAASTPESSPPSSRVVVPAGLPMLAYTYVYGIEAPASRIRGLVGGHEAACAAAGPTLCQVTSSSVSEAGKDSLQATLVFRAAPGWLKAFRDGLAGQAKAAGGRVVRAGVDSEDLSREIVDTEARLRAMTTLRDRLQALLATRPGKLSDLVELERELARVQGEIDSTQSQLAVMRGRVSMSEVTLSYASAGVIAPQGVLTPLIRAVTDFLGIIVFTIAAMVRLVAWLAPWALLVGGIWWLFRKRLTNLRWPFRAKPPREAP